jgi:hypothetical protein
MVRVDHGLLDRPIFELDAYERIGRALAQAVETELKTGDRRLAAVEQETDRLRLRIALEPRRSQNMTPSRQGWREQRCTRALDRAAEGDLDAPAVELAQL